MYQDQDLRASLNSSRNQVSSIQPIQLKSRKTHNYAKDKQKDSHYPEATEPIEMISLSARKTKVRVNKIQLERQEIQLQSIKRFLDNPTPSKTAKLIDTEKTTPTNDQSSKTNNKTIKHIKTCSWSEFQD